MFNLDITCRRAPTPFHLTASPYPDCLSLAESLGCGKQIRDEAKKVMHWQPLVKQEPLGKAEHVGVGQVQQDRSAQLKKSANVPTNFSRVFGKKQRQ